MRQTLLLVIGTLLLAACSPSNTVLSAVPHAAAAANSRPVEVEVARTPNATASPAQSELLDPMFGCGASGHIEYGLVNTPPKK